MQWEERTTIRHSSCSTSRRSWMVTGVVFLIVGLIGRMPYSIAMSADGTTASLAGDYLLWFIPAMALQFALVAMSSALRAAGNFQAGYGGLVGYSRDQHDSRSLPHLWVGNGLPARCCGRSDSISDCYRHRRRVAGDVLPAKGRVSAIRRRRLEAAIRSLEEDARHRASRRIRVRSHSCVPVHRLL